MRAETDNREELSLFKIPEMMKSIGEPASLMVHSPPPGMDTGEPVAFGWKSFCKRVGLDPWVLPPWKKSVKPAQ
jgi:hypothetical protein